MGMRGGRRLGEAGWRALLGRFAGSGLGVAAFCHREGAARVKIVVASVMQPIAVWL